MLKECLEVFQSELKEKGEEWLLSNYVPKDGTYILINLDDEYKVLDAVEIKTDKKTRKITGKTSIYYQLISFIDYYSKLLEMNKPVDSAKIIHSNNFYSFFVKKESITQEKITDTVVENYYSILSDPYKKYTKSQAKALYAQTENEVGPINTTLIKRIKNWVLTSMSDMLTENKIDLTRKEYLKIFFVYQDEQKTRELVRAEGTRYLLPNLFNKNDFNRVVGDSIYGLSNDDMGMNDKKPFLDNKSRKVKVPYLINLEEALIQSKFFDYLAGQAALAKYNIYIDFDEKKIKAYKNGEQVDPVESGMYLRIQPGKVLEIHDVDYITGYQTNLKQMFLYKNVTNVLINENSPDYGAKTKLYEIELLLDDVFFSKQLKYNYFTNPEDMMNKDGILKNLILIYRERMWNWFYKGKNKEFQSVLDKMALQIIFHTLNNTYFIKAQHQLNLWVSLVDYFNQNQRMEEQMENVRQALSEHIDEKDEWTFNSASEYYFAVGQMLDIFLHKSNAGKKSLSIVNPILNAKNDKLIKERIINLFKKYNYSFEQKDFRVRNLLGHIMEYEPEGEVEQRWVIAGFTMNSVLYKAKEKKELIKEVSENE